jgi:hypothetical protein
LPCSLFVVWLELDFSSVRSQIVFDGGMWGKSVAAAALVEGLFAVCICPFGGVRSSAILSMRVPFPSLLKVLLRLTPVEVKETS